MFPMYGKRVEGSPGWVGRIGLCLTWLALAVAGPVRAQDLPPLPIDLARPLADPQDPLLLTGDRTGALPLLAPRFSLTITGSHAPLYYAQGDDLPLDVRDVITASVAAALGLGAADLGVLLPVNLLIQGEQQGQPWTATSLGDVVVVPRVAPLPVGHAPVGLVLAVPVTIPTGDPLKYSGRVGFTAEPRVGFRAHPGRLALATRFGLRLQGRPQQGPPSLADMLTLRAAVGVGIGPTQLLRPELGFDGVLPLEAPEMASGTVLLGVVIRPVGGFSLGAHGGVGLGPLPGVAGGQLVVGVAWEGVGRARPTDPDGDGVMGSRDACPDLMEDYDGYRDGDGCPEADNDGDGVVDPADACPGQKGDTTTGCPPANADLDGDEVVRDRCPMQPEDLDGFQDEDGCPETDNDHDQIPDARDACPDQPEDGKGARPEDGCPS